MSRRYVKRIWRVPKDRGALERFATLVCKLMRKHGWPADWVEHRDFGQVVGGGAMQLRHYEKGAAIAPEMVEAFGIAVAIVARTYRVEVECYNMRATLIWPYEVTKRGDFRKVNNPA